MVEDKGIIKLPRYVDGWKIGMGFFWSAFENVLGCMYIVSRLQTYNVGLFSSQCIAMQTCFGESRLYRTVCVSS